jgi:predicted AAA+ superfamily ATPase
MKRDRSLFLVNWLDSKTRKPLIIRGARQTGKTWLIRDFAANSQKQLIELNFEKRPNLESLFSSNEPKEIISSIAASYRIDIEPKNAILFLDEIQAAPSILAKLRWFAEDMPELPVVAAGSLLDFALAENQYSMPVGRIGYVYLEPLSFEEFLDALGYHDLRKFLQSYELHKTFPAAIHAQLTSIMKEWAASQLSDLRIYSLQFHINSEKNLCIHMPIRK